MSTALGHVDSSTPNPVILSAAKDLHLVVNADSKTNCRSFAALRMTGFPEIAESRRLQFQPIEILPSLYRADWAVALSPIFGTFGGLFCYTPTALKGSAPRTNEFSGLSVERHVLPVTGKGLAGPVPSPSRSHSTACRPRHVSCCRN